EIARQESEADSELDSQIERIKESRDIDLNQLQAQIDEINDRFNEERDRLTDEVMREAQSLQRRIEALRGQMLTEPLVFESASEMIADAGEVVTNEMFSRIQAVVTARLSEIQTD
ncbi:MAG: hypothetical protein CUN49_18090, partial [Candidatus Thermofonsia Clade 1 bacterium]